MYLAACVRPINLLMPLRLSPFPLYVKLLVLPRLKTPAPCFMENTQEESCLLTLTIKDEV